MHDINLLEEQPIAWTPTPEVIERAQLTKFMRQVGVSTWEELYQYSIRDVEKFTEEVLKFLDIRFDPPYTKLLDTSNGVEFPNWLLSEPGAVATGFPSHAGLNITTMCLDRWQTHEMKDQPAVIWEGEDGSVETLTYKELFDEVSKCASGLRANGFGKGDAIGIHLPMLPETVVALLAINRIGAIAVPVFSGYGVEAIASRLDAVGAKALVTSLGFDRRGKWVDAVKTAFEAAERCDSVKKAIVVETPTESFLAQELERTVDEMAAASGGTNGKRKPEKTTSNISFKIHNLLDRLQPETFEIESWSAMLTRHNLAGRESLSNDPEPTSAEDPLIILYTSGTTGKPKGIAHTHASFPIKAAQDMAFGTDVGRGTRICWYTDIGWMMGPWLIYGALINGATICLYDGAPDYPTPDRMWEFCAKHKVEILGISPTLIRALAAAEGAGTQAPRLHERETRTSADQSPSADAGATTLPSGVAGGAPAFPAPHQRHDLSALRAFASTGEPWNPAPWWWLFEKVGDSKLPIINYSGGTEIAGGILMGNPLLPQKPCSFPAPCPGMDVDILDENGQPVKAGEVGELVIKQPWIGMARGFWQERERYLETYWKRFPGIWVHGDWAMRDADGHWFILGRSDDTLKVAGKRVGPAEVESLLVAHPLVTEAAVIGIPDAVKGTAMVAFCVLGTQAPSPASPSSGEPDAATLADSQASTTDATSSATGDLETELKTLVARDMGKPLAPSKIHFVSALPKTRNAKVMRRVIRAAYLGQDPGDLSALENPQAVEEIAQVKKETS